MYSLRLRVIFLLSVSSVSWLNAGQRHNLTLGERAVLQACEAGDAYHLKILVKQEKLNPNFPDPKTQKTPFFLALNKNTRAAKVLLENGANPYLGLLRTRSLYSESFKRGDKRGLHFLIQQNLPYVSRTNRNNKRLCQTLDLERLIFAGNIQCLRKALQAGIIPSATVSLEILKDTHKQTSKNATFARQALLLLRAERFRLQRARISNKRS